MGNEHKEWLDWVDAFEKSPEYVAENTKLDFAFALEQRMLQLGVSRADLARKLGTSAAAITATLRGDANLSIARMARLAHALDATVHVHLAAKAAKVRWLEYHESTPVPQAQMKSALAWAQQANGGKHARPTPFAA